MGRHDTAMRARRSHYRLMHRIYALISSDDFRIRMAKMRGNRALCRRLGLPSDQFVGMVDYEDDVIYVDFREDLVATVVHECLHVLIGERFSPGRAKAEEREVRRLERLVMRHMTPLQASRLLRLAAPRFTH